MTLPAQSLCFECEGAPLVGIHHPAEGTAECGIVIVVGGGPQYRAGGHRQLVLWSRRFAEEGYPVLRFDYRGMGDSHGDFSGFEDVDQDIRAAIDALMRVSPTVKRVILWGECDAASAILFYAHHDPRVIGAALLNPWARTEEGQAQTVLKHYYLSRLMQRSFWLKLLRLRFNPFKSLASLASMIALSRRQQSGPSATLSTDTLETLPDSATLPDRMFHGLTRFQGPIMLVMSGRDNIAREFDELLGSSHKWEEALSSKPTTRFDLPEADHTFSTRLWRDQVVNWGLQWLRDLPTNVGERSA